MNEPATPNTPMTPLIVLDDIKVTFHMGDVEVPVLKGISLRIKRGELLALMGASGSGKSTLMNVLGCLSHPSSGSCTIDGVEVSTLSRDARALMRNQKIGFVFQSFQLLPRTTAIEQVLMPMDYSPTQPSVSVCRARAEALLSRVGLKSHMQHTPNQMSGGEQQRVAIARALVNAPSILFADEPTGNLDSKTSMEILAMFRELNSVDGITIMLVTHDADVAAHADRTIRIKDGLIIDDANSPQAPLAADAALSVVSSPSGGAS